MSTATGKNINILKASYCRYNDQPQTDVRRIQSQWGNLYTTLRCSSLMKSETPAALFTTRLVYQPVALFVHRTAWRHKPSLSISPILIILAHIIRQTCLDRNSASRRTVSEYRSASTGSIQLRDHTKTSFRIPAPWWHFRDSGIAILQIFWLVYLIKRYCFGHVFS